VNPETPRYSLIIPAYNEGAYLPRLLASVELARESYRRGPEAVEVIVADNASTDETARIATERGCRVTPVSKRCIAAARNGGASAARGEVLTFLDADSRIHPRTFDEIDEALAGGRCVGGATGVSLERWSLGLAATYALLVPIATAFGMDAGVVFCRRKDFHRIGGYDERRLIAEDVDFLWRLRRLGRSDGRRLVRVTSAKAVASTRKFDKYGEWHYFTTVIPLAASMVFRKAAFEARVRSYWYEDR
jgi:glycosyltransferase involved in cell wall biosynthesis